jgi:hypothetical protein
MKKILLLLVSISAIGAVAFAQATPPVVKADSAKINVRICAVNRRQVLSVLYVIKSKNGEFKVKGGNTLSSISPQAIKSINVYKNSTAIKKYGNEARDGVVEIFLNDDKYPDLYNEIEKEVSKKN